MNSNSSTENNQTGADKNFVEDTALKTTSYKETEELQPPVEIPYAEINKEILSNIIESFILREGTDYGANEIATDTKIKQVQRQIEKGDVKIIFDPNTESVTLMNKRDWLKVSALSSL